MKRPPIKILPTKNKILSALNYDSKFGCFYWKRVVKNGFNKKLFGRLAGKKTNNGYLSVRIEKKDYLIHRLVWFVETGKQPKFIDHIDGNKMNNQISNLRASDVRSNGSNRHSHRNGRLVGATFNKKHGKWYSQIVIQKKSIWIGSFKTELEAHRAYMKAVAGLVEGRDK